MSLYNMLFGVNPNAEILLNMLELGTKYPIGRFRDIYLNSMGTKIILYTRNGGGNREHYDNDIEEGEKCDCTGCIMTYKIPNHPYYIEDKDDKYDCTYAYVKYRIPEEYWNLCSEMANGEKPEKIHEKFEIILDKLSKLIL